MNIIDKVVKKHKFNTYLKDNKYFNRLGKIFFVDLFDLLKETDYLLTGTEILSAIIREYQVKKIREENMNKANLEQNQIFGRKCIIRKIVEEIKEEESKIDRKFNRSEILHKIKEMYDRNRFSRTTNWRIRKYFDNFR